MNDLIGKPELIEIPPENRAIAIRINANGVSPYAVIIKGESISWPTSGSVYGEKLYGIMPSQDLIYIERHCFYLPSPSLHILQIDTSKLTTAYKNPGWWDEVVFTSCNVLFHGNLIDFLAKIGEFVTPLENEKINNVLRYRANEITKSFESEEAKKEHLKMVVNRIVRLKTCSNQGGDSFMLFLNDLASARGCNISDIITPQRLLWHYDFTIKKMIQTI